METFVCLVCKETYSTLRGLRQHERVMKHSLQVLQEETPPGEFIKCEYCTLVFTPIEMRNHVEKVHRKEKVNGNEIYPMDKSHKCNLCEEAFYALDSLDFHIREIHSKVEEHTSNAHLQPQPTINQESQIILHKVLVDLINRSEHGQKTYGTFLQSHNGRNALLDAYEEALDLCMYLRQALDEQTKKREFASSRSERE